jgi:hypothetical protein
MGCESERGEEACWKMANSTNEDWTGTPWSFFSAPIRKRVSRGVDKSSLAIIG